MISLSEIFDSYGRRARLFPAFLATSPVFVLAAAYLPMQQVGLEHVGFPFLGAALLYFLADVARRRGKAVEQELVTLWGGYPSQIMLRHSDSTVDPFTKLRYHGRAMELVNNVELPNPADEKTNPFEADQRYASVVRFLLANTRDPARFGLLLKENTNYGFRRNLYGLKKIAIFILGICTVYVFWSSLDRVNIGELPNQPDLLVLALFAVTLVLWLAFVTRASVREAADEYARQLLTSLEVL